MNLASKLVNNTSNDFSDFLLNSQPKRHIAVNDFDVKQIWNIKTWQDTAKVTSTRGGAVLGRGVCWAAAQVWAFWRHPLTRIDNACIRQWREQNVLFRISF